MSTETKPSARELAAKMYERHVMLLQVCIECRETWPCVGYQAASELERLADLEAEEERRVKFGCCGGVWDDGSDGYMHRAECGGAI